MASVSEIAPLSTEFDLPEKKGTRGPDKGPRVPGGFKKAVEEIANVIFSKTRISVEGAAKAVIPSIPKMLTEIAEDIRTGSVDKFKISLNKLENIIGQLGIDLKKYNKDLANFLDDRSKNTIESERKIIEMRERGAKAEINEITGKINVLSRAEIKQRTETLRQVLKDTKRIKREKEKEEKQVQKSAFLSEAEIEVKKEFIEKSYEQLQDLETRKETLKSTLGIESDEDLPGTGFFGGFGRGNKGGMGGGEGIREFVPNFIMDFVDNFRDQLMGFVEPFIILKDVVFDLLKPLRIFGKLFKPLLAGMGRLIKQIGRQIMVGMLLVATNLLRLLTDKKVLIGLAALAGILGLKKLHDKFKDGPDGPKAGSAGDMDAEASHEQFDFVQDAKVSKRDSKDPNAPFYDKNSRQIIQPDNPNYFKLKKANNLPMVGMNERIENNKQLIESGTPDGPNNNLAVPISTSSNTSNSATNSTVISAANQTSDFYDVVDGT